VTNPNKGPLKVGNKDRTVPVPFRAGSPGVINMKKLNEALAAVPGSNMASPVPPAQFAMQMLRFPLRQVFGDTTVPPEFDAFVATVKLDLLTERFQLASKVLGA